MKAAVVIFLILCGVFIAAYIAAELTEIDNTKEDEDNEERNHPRDGA